MTIDCTSVPPWLKVMRSITGMTEEPGAADNAKILGMRDWVACMYSEVPGLVKYAETYQHDETPWCSLAAAFCVTVAGIMPPFKADDDLASYYWAKSFSTDPNYDHLDEPVLGAIVVMERDGGGHVTMFEGWTNNSHTDFKARGGNQSDAVNVQTYSTDGVICWCWPHAMPLPVPVPEPPETAHETIQRGSTGADVEDCQHILGLLPVDGEFGGQTEAGVKGFQDAVGLASDGVVGPATWGQLDALDARMAAGSDDLDPALKDEIVRLAKDSSINSYNWHDRGNSPPGYIAGMACTFAVALQRFADGDSSVRVMAQAERNNPDTDALSWLREEFDAQGMDNSKPGSDTLRHLFVLLIGLAMRESSGDHWCGRDQSATNTSPDSAEAGLHQTSWDIRSASPEIPRIGQAYWDDPNGFRDIFSEGLSPSTAELENYGNGANGTAHQWLSKFCPAYHVMMTAVGLRTRRQHWGPINKKAVEIKQAADQLLRDVEDVVCASW